MPLVKRPLGAKWVDAGYYNTAGPAETIFLDLPRGYWRVIVWGKYGYIGVTSPWVFLNS